MKLKWWEATLQFAWAKFPKMEMNGWKTVPWKLVFTKKKLFTNQRHWVMDSDFHLPVLSHHCQKGFKVEKTLPNTGWLSAKAVRARTNSQWQCARLYLLLDVIHLFFFLSWVRYAQKAFFSLSSYTLPIWFYQVQEPFIKVWYFLYLSSVRITMH